MQKMKCSILKILCMIFLFLLACQEEMESISQVTKFRVLGIQNEPPDAVKGEDMKISTLYHSESGKVESLAVVLKGSMIPSSEIGMKNEMLFGPVFSSDNNGEFVFTIPSSVLAEHISDKTTWYNATSVILLCEDGQFPDMNEFVEMMNEMTSLSEVSKFCKGGTAIVSVKDFEVFNTEPEYNNINPVIERMVFDNTQHVKPLFDETDKENDEVQAGEIVCDSTDSKKCNEKVPIVINIDLDSLQQYEKEEFGKPQVVNERAYISWFVTGGEFSSDRSGSELPPGHYDVYWTPPEDEGEFFLWAVAHDIRGGVSWKKYLVKTTF